MTVRPLDILVEIIITTLALVPCMFMHDHAVSCRLTQLFEHVNYWDIEDHMAASIKCSKLAIIWAIVNPLMDWLVCSFLNGLVLILEDSWLACVVYFVYY
jgi:hypothetical protein